LKRPVVEPELFASLRPPDYSGGLIDPNGELPANRPMRVPPMRALGAEKGKADEGKAEARAGLGGFGFAGRSGATHARETLQRLGESLDLGASVASAASASRLGDYFQYAVEQPVMLPRQKSALLPILGKPVGGRRVSIYNEATHARFAL